VNPTHFAVESIIPGDDFRAFDSLHITARFAEEFRA